MTRSILLQTEEVPSKNMNTRRMFWGTIVLGADFVIDGGEKECANPEGVI